jgi:predicted ATP-grasp superfamily ATP-dependent carboligase
MQRRQSVMCVLRRLKCSIEKKEVYQVVSTEQYGIDVVVVVLWTSIADADADTLDFPAMVRALQLPAAEVLLHKTKWNAFVKPPTLFMLRQRRMVFC